MSNEVFLFVSSAHDFEEATATAQVTFMELEKKSENGNVYRTEDSEHIIKTLIGSPIRLGITIFGQHKKGVETRQVGEVTEAYREGNKIKGIIKIFAEDIISKLKAGMKFLLSIGGFFESIKKLANRIIGYKPTVTHVQLFEPKEGQAGFSTAKVERLLEINESVMLVGSQRKMLAVLVGLDII